MILLSAMADHKGIRPQDIIVVLWFALNHDIPYTLPMLGEILGISASEISKSIKRSQYAGLMNSGKKVAKKTFLEFLQYGLPYVFPTRLGAPVRGIPTAVSHPQIQTDFASDEQFVWPHMSGTVRGHTIEPLYQALPRTILLNPELYLATALMELFRIGNTRERKVCRSSSFQVARYLSRLFTLHS